MTDTTDATPRPTAISDFFQPPPEVDPEVDPEIHAETEPDTNTQSNPQSNQQSDPDPDDRSKEANNPGEAQDREQDQEQRREEPEKPPPEDAAAASHPEQSSHTDPALDPAVDPALDPAFDRAAVERLYRRGVISLDAAKRAAAIIRGEAPAFRNQTPPKQSPNQQQRKPRPSPTRQNPVIPDDYEDTHPLGDNASQQPAQQSTSRQPARQQRPPQEAVNNQNGDTDQDIQQQRKQQTTTPAPQDEEFLGRWTALIKKLSRSKGEKFNLGALLRDCPTHHLIWDGGLLTAHFKVRENLNRLKEELADPQMVELVQTAFRAEFGEDAQITFTGPRD